MYEFKYGGQSGEEYQFVEAKELVVIRTEGGTDLKIIELSQASRDLLSKIIPLGDFLKANKNGEILGKSGGAGKSIEQSMVRIKKL